KKWLTWPRSRFGPDAIESHRPEGVVWIAAVSPLQIPDDVVRKIVRVPVLKLSQQRRAGPCIEDRGCRGVEDNLIGVRCRRRGSAVRHHPRTQPSRYTFLEAPIPLIVDFSESVNY